MAAVRRHFPRILAPEVVQTSAMDCGPAALKCLLDGFGIPASYGRLREACQTDVDGTSIDTLEDLANAVGLIAEQTSCPSITCSCPRRRAARHRRRATARRSSAFRRRVASSRTSHAGHGSGDRPPVAARDGFTDELYEHTMPVPADAWRSWAESTLFHDGLRARAHACGLNRRVLDGLLLEASRDQGWHGFATVDATLRIIAALRRTGGFSRADADRTFVTIWKRARSAADPAAVVPSDYWTVRPASPRDGREHVLVRGAVLVSVRGVQPAEDRARKEAELPLEVVAALREAPLQPARHLLSLLQADGVLAPAALLIALVLAAAGVVVEALLFRSLLDLGAHLSLTGQRLATMAAIVCLSGLLLLLEVPVATMALGVGRRLETRLRAAFLRKIPRLPDRYLQSRPSSDMAERAHSAHQIRELPNLGAQFAKATLELILTTVGIVLLYPGVALDRRGRDRDNAGDPGRRATVAERA